jgi:hypothetical protein
MGNVTFRDNRFHNLTWAIFAWADAVAVRLEDNIVTRCGGGIWIQPTQASAINPLINPTTAFQEFPIFWVLPIFLYPIHDIIGTSPPPPAAPGALSLFVTNNQVETILPPTQLSPPVGGAPSNQGSSSLVLLVNRPPAAGLDTTSSLVISNNRLRNQNSQAPTAIMLVSASPQRTVISANLIFNEFRRPPVGGVSQNGPSLQITLASGELVGLFTVVGNALLGPTNLQSLIRSDPQTPIGPTWVPFNSIVP